MGLLPVACWDCGFKSCQRHGSLSIVSVVCCQVEVEVSVWGWSRVQSSPTECGVSKCDRVVSIVRRSWPTKGCCTMEKKMKVLLTAVAVVSSRTVLRDTCVLLCTNSADTNRATACTTVLIVCPLPRRSLCCGWMIDGGSQCWGRIPLQLTPTESKNTQLRS